MDDESPDFFIQVKSTSYVSFPIVWPSKPENLLSHPNNGKGVFCRFASNGEPENFVVFFGHQVRISLFRRICKAAFGRLETFTRSCIT